MKTFEQAIEMARNDFYAVRGGDDREMGFWEMGFEDGWKSLQAELDRLREALERMVKLSELQRKARPSEISATLQFARRALEGEKV